MNKSSGTIYHVSPKGVSIKDDTNNKSSGTSSGTRMCRIRTKGWNYHASPEGFYMDVDGRATHMYRTYGQIIAPAISALLPSVVVVLGQCRSYCRGAVAEVIIRDAVLTKHSMELSSQPLKSESHG